MSPINFLSKTFGPRRFLTLLPGLLVLVWLAAAPARAQGPWEGTWITDYGQVLLRQDGRRVWGDYVDQGGVIEARVTPDGRSIRGTFLRADQSWGWLYVTRTNSGGWFGNWRWNDIPTDNDPAWNADGRYDVAPPVLRNAVGPGPFWPPTYAGAPFGRYAEYVFGPGGIDPYVSGTPTPAPVPAPVPSTGGIVHSSLDGAFEIVDQAGRWLGTLDLGQRADGSVFGSGAVVFAGVERNIIVSTAAMTAEGFDLALEIATIPATPEGRLLVSVASGAVIEGTLVRPEGWVPVTIRAFDGEDLYDTPGIGVYGPPYQLRNTAGDGVVLRAAPQSDAAVQGQVPGFATDMLVLGCTPEIDSLQWEQSSLSARWQLLDGVWCEVSYGGQAPGWLPGFFLDPIPQ